MPSVDSRQRRSPDTLNVGFDFGPLHGHRTGIGQAVAAMAAGLGASTEVELRPYVISARAKPADGETRLPLPGIAASHLWSRTSWLRADRWLGAIDVLHGTNYVAPPTRRPTVISVYDCWFLTHPDLAAPVVSRAGRWLRRAVDNGAWVHCSSAATATAAASLLATDRTRVIRLGPPAPLPPPQRPTGMITDRIDIVAVGTEERRKGSPDIIAAFGRRAADDTDLYLAIAGAPGDDSEHLTAAIERLAPSTRRRIVRLGPVSDAEKAWLFEHASVLAYPSLDEGFGFPILEANRAGVPIVARAAGSIPEVAGNAAVLVPSGNGFAADLADAISNVLSDGDLRARLTGAGETNLARFSWERCTTGLIELYRTAVDN